MNVTQFFKSFQQMRSLRAERLRFVAELESMNARDLADLNINAADFPAMIAEHMRRVASKA